MTTETREDNGRVTVPEPDEGSRHRVARRLEALRAEFDKSQALLADAERQQVFLRERLLMLRGAIQALDDLRAELDDAASSG